MTKLKFVCLTVVLMAFGALQAQAQGQAPIELLMNWLPEPQFGGFYAAEVEGIFAKKGLSVKILPGGSGTPTVQMVAAGKVSFAVASSEEIIVGRARGNDVTALFASFQASPVIIMTHAERGFKSLQDVWQSPGILAIQSGLPYFQFMQHKLGPAKVTMVPNNAGVTNFIANPQYSQQGFLTAEPFLAQKKGAKVKSFLVSDLGYNPYLTVLIAKAAYLEQNDEVARKMVEAVREGWQAYLDHPEKTNAAMHKLNPAMDLEAFAQSSQAQRSLIESADTKAHGLGYMSAQRWQELAQQLQDVKLIKKIPDLSRIQKTWASKERN